MFYVTSKSGKAGTVITLLKSTYTRDQARAFASANNGTVRTQAEYAELMASGRMARTVVAFETEAAPVVAPVAIVAPVAATVAPVADEAPAPVAATWVDIAKSVNTVSKALVTLGKKEKHLKRVVSSDATLEAAAEALAALPADTTKVGAVRFMAAWVDADGNKLQRGEALVLFAQAFAGAIAPATVSTQWQLVRSGKLAAK